MNISLRTLVLIPLAAFAATAEAGQGDALKAERSIRQFASDFSGGDPVILSKVDAYIAQPPTRIEDIGFYGMESASPDTRIYLATVSLLSEQHHLYSFEDKYMMDLFVAWIEDGVLDPNTLPPEAAGVFRPFFDLAYVEPLYAEGIETPPALADYVAYADAHYGAATLQLEEAVERASGKALLSVDATGGDTMFFALAPHDIANKWLNTGLAVYDGYSAGIREPMWDYFWYDMVYALQLPTVGDSYTRPLPEGTRERRALLPPAK